MRVIEIKDSDMGHAYYVNVERIEYFFQLQDKLKLMIRMDNGIDFVEQFDSKDGLDERIGALVNRMKAI